MRLGSRTGTGPVKSSPLFAEGRGLADSLTEEVQSRPARVAMAHELDLLHAWRMDHEGALDADAARDSPYGDLLVYTAVADAKHGALEVLKALAALRRLAR